ARRRRRRDGRDPQPRGAGAPRRAAHAGGGVTQTKRLPAIERRQAVLDEACNVFSRMSYRGATTAEIARAAGISEPILYRHFGSKRDLYLACLDETWQRFRLAADRDPVAEAWIFIAGGMLVTVDNRLGGLLGEDLARVRTERRRFMLGETG